MIKKSAFTKGSRSKVTLIDYFNLKHHEAKYLPIAFDGVVIFELFLSPMEFLLLLGGQ